MLVRRRVTTSSTFASKHLYSRVKRGTMRLKCLAQEHNAVPPPGLEPGLPDPAHLVTNNGKSILISQDFHYYYRYGYCYRYRHCYHYHYIDRHADISRLSLVAENSPRYASLQIINWGKERKILKKQPRNKEQTENCSIFVVPCDSLFTNPTSSIPKANNRRNAKLFSSF